MSTPLASYLLFILVLIICRYGLVLPEKGKKGPTFQASRNVFGDDSDSDKETSRKPILLRPSHNINRQVINLMKN